MKNNLGIPEFINILLELGKVRITFFVAFSTAIGFILYSGNITVGILIPVIGVFFLASGASALNHFQERITDGLMERTRNRPIPSGKITKTFALIVSIIWIILGSLILFFEASFEAGILGWIALIWYNIIYTPLKMKYAMAVVPGSLIGAIPPVIGWVAAGGLIYNPQILALALFFFIWQIPHFWLLLLIYGKDYEKAGFPTLTKIFNDHQLSRITFVWIFALAISCLLIPLFSISSNFITIAALIVLGLWLIISSLKIIDDIINRIVYKKAFMNINIYVLMVVLVLSLDKLVLTEI
ncbi:MAG: protoheme IX farnesyltransferase [Melioribacteraceae bacterium]|nr:protoheme IX farnesyltransferase [Melioribacteraceae bacterium]MCF8354415.1 protoheme IX farnesyltransferase [Melioribacteraceae bacterium]MCF8392988.1 protoheme IX farnesyltransferase [Melioribacteraceae bacterium]MCF8417269.1 protoheme IX farnesyltransferase [Melioribacteraceae bacterium]